jgi:hypothetical protein
MSQKVSVNLFILRICLCSKIPDFLKSFFQNLPTDFKIKKISNYASLPAPEPMTNVLSSIFLRKYP